jgi:hypothetical protein
MIQHGASNTANPAGSPTVKHATPQMTRESFMRDLQKTTRRTEPDKPAPRKS